jgi:hypothetical protein
MSSKNKAQGFTPWENDQDHFDLGKFYFIENRPVGYAR